MHVIINSKIHKCYFCFQTSIKSIIIYFKVDKYFFVNNKKKLKNDLEYNFTVITESLRRRFRNAESVWVKVFANKTSHFVASWYRPPGRDLDKLESQLTTFKRELENIKEIHKGNKLPISPYSGGFNFCDIVWPDRLRKSGSPLSLSEGEISLKF